MNAPFLEVKQFGAAVLNVVAAIAFAGLSGCAALQIDVDVYKGPLVNNEEIQQQQMISMALSAKLLMMTARNKLIRDALGPDVELKYLGCKDGIYSRDYLLGKQVQSASDEDVARLNRQKVRQAIQLNSLLTFYYDEFATGNSGNYAKTAISNEVCRKWDSNDTTIMSGRNTDGIETLANRLLAAEVQAKGVPNGKAERDELNERRRQIEVALVDLAARMQFLATNQWLVEQKEGTEDDFETLKPLLEAIANTILVHADDIQNRRNFEARANASVITEELASQNLALVQSDAVLDRIEAAMLELKLDADNAALATAERKDLLNKQKRRAAEKPAAAGTVGGKQPVSPAQAAAVVASPPTATEWAKAIELIHSHRERVAVKIKAGTCAPAFAPLIECLRSSLKVPDTAEGAVTASVAQTALDIIAKSRVPKRQGATPRSPTDVMDQVIAVLRYQQLDALAKGETRAATIASALAEAKRQRADMVFLRPSSSYLRSVFASTSTQDDPKLGWRNLLNDQVLAIGSHFRSLGQQDVKRSARETKAELDKAFWQNINTVRVNGASGTNFVVAKDDVGNWYVKSMGTDPSAMVKAAKNLALFNLGGTFNTNLLRVSELRETVADKTASEPDRTRAKNELDGLLKGSSGPAVGARKQTLGLFEDNYMRQSQAQHADLSAQVTRDSFTAELKARWDLTMKDSPVGRSALDAAFTHPTVALAASQAKAASAPLATGTVPSNAILDMLEALIRYQEALKAQVDNSGALVLTESNGARDAASQLVASETDLATSLARLTNAEKTLQAAEAADSTASTTTTTSILARAQNDYLAARVAVETATASLTTKRVASAAANNTLALAVGRRTAAVADIDATILLPVRTLAEKRIRGVEEMETAVKVVGQSKQQ